MSNFIAFCVVNLFIDLLYLSNHALLTIYSWIGRGYLKWKYQLLDENIMHNICLTTDLDYNMHMNNARYLRDCDFARAKLWLQTRVLKVISKLGGGLVLGGSAARYRKEITLFTVYTIQSRIIYWDSKSFYMEQKFVRRSDGFVCCEVLAKQTLIGGVTTDQVIGELDYPVTKPECPPQVAKWIEYNEISSEKLRKKAK